MILPVPLAPIHLDDGPWTVTHFVLDLLFLSSPHPLLFMLQCRQTPYLVSTGVKNF